MLVYSSSFSLANILAFFQRKIAISINPKKVDAFDLHISKKVVDVVSDYFLNWNKLQHIIETQYFIKSRDIAGYLNERNTQLIIYVLRCYRHYTKQKAVIF